MSSVERERWEAKHDRDYYATHRSARLARWGIILGLVICAVGFGVSMAYSRGVADLGNVLMVLGMVFAIIALFFTATVRS